MLLIDNHPLEADALSDPKHKLHDFAKEYDDALTYLHDRYKNGFIRFKRIGYPKFTKGADSAFREVPKVKEPTPPMRIPLQAYATVGKLGKHHWACCLDAPKVLPNGLWEMGKRKAFTIEEDVLININEEPDLAFFFFKISPFIKKGLIKVLDPAKDDVEIGEAESLLTDRKYAVWKQLGDIDKLKRMARAYGVSQVDDKQPNQIRKELETVLERNDVLRRTNPAVKGTREFLEEMMVTDGVLLRAFVQKAIDDKKLACGLNGDWKVGDKIIIKVPASELKRKPEYLCDYLSAGNNIDKLQEFLRDLINTEYLEGITEKKEWEWLAKIANVPHQFKKIEEIKTGVQKFYAPV
jgi:hypothetical protein